MTPAEIAALVELFQTLEPPIQEGIAALIRKAHTKQLTAQDYLNQAAVLVNKPAGS